MDHIIIGAGVSGVLAAKELKAKGKSFVIIEKTTEVGGIWASTANVSSHVAVSEPSYRFDFGEESTPMEDFTETSEVKDELQRFAHSFKLLEHIRFGAHVTGVKRTDNLSTVVYQHEGREHIIRSHGTFIAVGAQQKPRKLTFPGEESFDGSIGYGIRNDINLGAFDGAHVCIIDGGAFSIENLRTALLKGAKKVTIISRNKFQCWPRSVHYRSSCGDTTWGELKCLYDKAVAWAGMIGMMDPFMSPNTKTQPVASDFFFLAFKEEKLDLVFDEVLEILPGKILTLKGLDISCDLILKCVGWEEAQMSEVYADFKHRDFCFLNGHASLVSCSDTVYSHSNDPTFNMEYIEDRVVSGSNSVVFLAMAIIRLQLFFMDHPDQFSTALKQMVRSSKSTCSWMQERLHYVGLPEA